MCVCMFSCVCVCVWWGQRECLGEQIQFPLLFFNRNQKKKGGYGGDVVGQKCLQMYNALTRKWGSLPDMPLTLIKPFCLQLPSFVTHQAF